MNKTKGELKNGEIVHDQEKEDSVLLKMLVLPSLVYRFIASLIKVSASYFVDIDKLILIYMGRQQIQNNQHNIEEKQNLKTDTIQMQNLLYRYSNQDSVASVRE